MPYNIRYKNLREKLKKETLDAFFVSNPKNIYYLTGLDLSNHPGRETTLLVTLNSRELFVPRMYENEVKDLFGVKAHILSRGNELFQKPKEMMEDINRVGFESSDLNFDEYQFLKKENKAELIAFRSLIEDIRTIKDESEIEIMRQTMEITSKAMIKALKKLKVGMTEREFAKIIQREAEDIGSNGMSFGTIVASGRNSAKPHHQISDKKIEEGILLIDMGASFKGYNGDITRTFFIGEPDEEFIKKYNFCLDANQNSIKKIREEVTFDELWQESVDSLGEYSEAFTSYHTLGHGIGLDVHEGPIVYKENKERVKRGMVFTIEPGIYFPEWGGIRIEDYCAVTNNGIEIFSKVPRSYSIEETIKNFS